MKKSRWGARLIPGCALTVAVGLVNAPISGAPPAKAITLTPLGVYQSFLFDKGGAEIAAYDPATRRVFVVNVGDVSIDVLDISNPADPFLIKKLDLKPYGSHANSVAVHDGLVAVAVENAVKTNPGLVVFFDASGTPLRAVTAGALPDMVTFSPNGQLVLVANEGEPNDPYTIDPDGSVTIIDISRGVAALTSADVTTAGFTQFNGAELDPSIRIYGPHATVAQDLEPEYIAISQDSKRAWVTLQENNALALIDLKTKTVTDLVGLGFKNHNVPGQGLDASDQNGSNNIQNWPVFGMYQPDGIHALDLQGKTYLVTANEGDVREWAGLPGGTEARRVSSLTLDSAAFPNGALLKTASMLGRLNVTIVNGDTDHDGDFDQLYSFGARSFSIWDERGKLVFDSGDALETLTAGRYPLNFNASNTNNTRDNRSDDKGPEPEGVTVAKLFGRNYAFIALERIGGVVVYEIIDPAAPTFVQYINVRDFSATPGTPSAGDLGPEGLFVIDADQSPNGQPLLVVANEISGTTRIFNIAQAK